MTVSFGKSVDLVLCWDNISVLLHLFDRRTSDFYEILFLKYHEPSDWYKLSSSFFAFSVFQFPGTRNRISHHRPPVLPFLSNPGYVRRLLAVSQFLACLFQSLAKPIVR